MSYRNPAKLVDTQSGQHYRNMQQSLAKTFTGVVDADTARIKAETAKTIKEQAELRKKLQTQESDAYKTALQANQETGTSVRYDNMQENLQYNAHLASKPAGSLTSEERVWMQNFKNVGSSIKTVLSNIVSGRESYDKQNAMRPGSEGSIAATDDNIKKQKAMEIWLNGKDGTSHAFFDGTTGETTLIARDSDGVEVGRVTSNGKDYSFETVANTQKERDANVKMLKGRIASEGISSDVYGINPESTPVKDPETGITKYFLTPTEEGIKKGLRTQALATIQSMTPAEQKNWYNATQADKPGFEEITESWTNDDKYTRDSSGRLTNDPSPVVNKITDALVEQTFTDNKTDLMKATGFASKPPKSEEGMNAAQIKEMKNSKIYIAGYKKLVKLTSDDKVINAFKDIKKHPETSLKIMKDLLSKFEKLRITEYLADGFMPTKEKEDPDMKDVDAIRIGVSPTNSVTINLEDSSEVILDRIMKAYMLSKPMGDDAVEQVKNKANNLTEGDNGVYEYTPSTT
jgi:hypothetical protein